MDEGDATRSDTDTVPRIALAQFGGSINGSANVRQVELMAREAAAQGANLVCFPEVSNTVYMPWENDPRHFDNAESAGGPSVEAVRAVARDTAMMIVYPLFERDGDHYFNTVLVIGVDGSVLGKHRKSSVATNGLFSGGSERTYFYPGDLPFCTFDTPWGFRLGLIICYERNLPEPARCAALQGADLLLCPVATTATVRPWWELLLRAHAVFNIFYVGACNKVGQECGGAPDTAYFGTSLGIDPAGNVVAKGSDTVPEIVLFDMDMDLLHAQRQRWSFFQDRRPDLYQVLARPLSGARTQPSSDREGA